jgi:hypothetical protein
VLDRERERQPAIERARGYEAKSPDQGRDAHRPAELSIVAQGLERLNFVRRPAPHAERVTRIFVKGLAPERKGS